MSWGRLEVSSCISTLVGVEGDSEDANGVWWKDDVVREAAVSQEAVGLLTESWDAKGTSTSA